MTLRSAATRAAMALALSGSLALTACGSDGKDEATSSTEPISTSTVVGSSGPLPSAPAEVALTNLEPASARSTFGEVYKNLLTSRSTTGEEAAAARAGAVRGQQATVSEAEAKTAAATQNAAKPDPEATATPPVFLTVTTKDSPHKLVLGEGQPVKANLPELYLAETPDVAGNLRITHAARMLPDRLLQKLQPPATGIPEVAPGTPIGGTTPEAFLNQYAAFVTYPLPEGDIAAQPFQSDPYITGVRSTAQARARDLGEHGTYVMKNEIVPDSTRVLQRADGALIVFTHLVRNEGINLKEGASFEAPAAVQGVNPELKKVTKEATMQTDVCLVFYMYPGAKAELVAASEQLVGATGS